jgi:hypothetical protein
MKTEEKIIVLIGEQCPYGQVIQLPLCEKSIDITIDFLKKYKKVLIKKGD